MMKKVLLIVKKDIKEIIKDKTAVLLMIAFPILMFPGLNILVSKIVTANSETQKNAIIKIGYLSETDDSKFIKFLEGKSNVSLTKFRHDKDLLNNVTSDTMDAGIILDPQFDQDLLALKSGKMNIYIKSTETEAKKRISEYAYTFNLAMMEKRLNALKINHENINPTNLNFHDVASNGEKAGSIMGALLPYFFIIFGFSACRITAIDIFTKEKERGAIELLLTAPIRRSEILIGKLIVVLTAGLFTILLTIFGMILTLTFSDSLPAELKFAVSEILEFKFMILLLLLAVPLSIFFCGFIIPIAISCSSHKQSESVLNPVLLVMMIPAMSGFFPNLELTFLTSLFPLVNISLVTKEILSGTIHYGLYATTCLSLILLASVGLVLSAYFFNQEDRILKV